MVMPSSSDGRLGECLEDDRLRAIPSTDARELLAPGGCVRMAKRIGKGDVLWISRPAVLCRTIASNGLAKVCGMPDFTDYVKGAYEVSRTVFK